MEAFLNFWGIVFIVTTAVVVALRLKEPEEESSAADVPSGFNAGRRDDIEDIQASPEETLGLLGARFASLRASFSGPVFRSFQRHPLCSFVTRGHASLPCAWFHPRHSSQAAGVPKQSTSPSVWAGLRHAYREMVSIMQLRAVGMACLFSVTVKVGFLAESALQFELMEKGVKKEQMLLLGLPLLAIEVGAFIGSRLPCVPLPYNRCGSDG
jgi:hypothetical protein